MKKNDDLQQRDNLIDQQSLDFKKKLVLSSIQSQRNRLLDDKKHQIQGQDEQDLENIVTLTDEVELVSKNNTAIPRIQTVPQFDDNGELMPPDVAHGVNSYSTNGFPRSLVMKLATNKIVLLTMATLLVLPVGNKAKKSIARSFSKKKHINSETITPKAVNSGFVSLLVNANNLVANVTKIIAVTPVIIKSFIIWKNFKK